MFIKIYKSINIDISINYNTLTFIIILAYQIMGLQIRSEGFEAQQVIFAQTTQTRL